MAMISSSYPCELAWAKAKWKPGVEAHGLVYLPSSRPTVKFEVLTSNGGCFGLCLNFILKSYSS